MIAKIVAHKASRSEAIDRLVGALEHTIVAGPRTNVAFLAALCRAGEFRDGRFDTDFIDRNLGALGAAPRPVDRGAAAAGAARLIAREAERIVRRGASIAPLSPWDVNDAFQLTGSRTVSLGIRVDGEDVSVDGVPAAPDSLAVDGVDAVYVLRGGRQTVVTLEDAAIDIEHLDGDGLVRAPMHGKLLVVLVATGDAVTKGQRLAVIEAMKMEHSL